MRKTTEEWVELLHAYEPDKQTIKNYCAEHEIAVCSFYQHRSRLQKKQSSKMQLELPATNGAVFVFCNKNRDKLKILYWDKTGFALWYKRLERERFKWPTQVDDETLSLSEQQLHWLLQGYVTF